MKNENPTPLEAFKELVNSQVPEEFQIVSTESGYYWSRGYDLYPIDIINGDFYAHSNFLWETKDSTSKGYKNYQSVVNDIIQKLVEDSKKPHQSFPVVGRWNPFPKSTVKRHAFT